MRDGGGGPDSRAQAAKSLDPGRRGDDEFIRMIVVSMNGAGLPVSPVNARDERTHDSGPR